MLLRYGPSKVQWARPISSTINGSQSLSLRWSPSPFLLAKSRSVGTARPSFCQYSPANHQSQRLEFRSRSQERREGADKKGVEAWNELAPHRYKKRKESPISFVIITTSFNPTSLPSPCQHELHHGQDTIRLLLLFLQEKFPVDKHHPTTTTTTT